MAKLIKYLEIIQTIGGYDRLHLHLFIARKEEQNREGEGEGVPDLYQEAKERESQRR